MENLSAVQTQFSKSVNEFLTFFADDRSTNLLRSFSSLSQCYVDLRATALHGTTTKTTASTTNETTETTNSSFFIDNATQTSHSSSRNKFLATLSRADDIYAVSSQLLNEALSLLNRVKELGHMLLLTASAANQQDHSQEASTTININVRLLQDSLEHLINKLQGKMVTVHVVFNEVWSAIKDAKEIFSSPSSSEKQITTTTPKTISWKISVDQLRIYQTAIAAEFTNLSNEALRKGSSGNIHPLETLSSNLDRISGLCGKIQRK